ncbi:MAG: WhiB family transcriptional regulator [Acidimicrobiaceae bacterium]|nr:WhiB family transcriptional regulator [Acidimicrobiaceae bacterium]
MESKKLATWNFQNWREGAKCKDVDPAMFFPVGVTGEAEVQIINAKRYCSDCQVQNLCLEFALRTNQEYGIWGGKDEEERRAIRRVRRHQKKLAQAS